MMSTSDGTKNQIGQSVFNMVATRTSGVASIMGVRRQTEHRVA